MRVSRQFCLISNARSAVVMLVAYTCCALLLLSGNQNCAVSAKSLDHAGHMDQHAPPHTHALSDTDTKNTTSCDTVQNFFQSISINIRQDMDNKGPICGGHCCSHHTEDDLIKKSRENFERLLLDHTKSLLRILESTSKSFTEHITLLLEQSEAKTLNVFSIVYRRMLPLSKELIGTLYGHILQYFNGAEDSLDDHIQTFFYNLFPIAYHQEVHLNNNNQSTGDLSDDYITCLKNSFGDLHPFGDVPKELSKNLVQSMDAAKIFVNALNKGAEILSDIYKKDMLHTTDHYLSPKCQTHLLKMSYCKECNGISKPRAKTCYGYCLNVMRGCLAHYVGILDSPWGNVADSIERLVSTSIQTDNGIVNVIKGLDTELSEAIMKAMGNGPELEKKIKKACGKPELLPAKNSTSKDIGPIPTSPVKWATPSDPELLDFLSTIHTTRDFYSKVVDNICEDEEYQRNDQHCWNGERIGGYTQNIMPMGVDTQRYNPEVPLTQDTYSQSTKLSELVDKLIKLRSTIVSALPTHTRAYSDIQGDMARHDEEGSGGRQDEQDYDDTAGSGSGFGPTSSPVEPDVSPRTIPGSTPSGSSTLVFSALQILVFCIIASLVSH